MEYLASEQEFKKGKFRIKKVGIQFNGHSITLPTQDLGRIITVTPAVTNFSQDIKHG